MQTLLPDVSLHAEKCGVFEKVPLMMMVVSVAVYNHNPPQKTAVFGRPRPTWNSVCMRVYKLSECPVKWLAFVSLTQVLF